MAGKNETRAATHAGARTAPAILVASDNVSDAALVDRKSVV